MKSRIFGIIKSEHPSSADKKQFIDKVYLRCYNTQKKELIDPILFASENMLFMLSTGLKDKRNRFAYHLDIVEDQNSERWLIEWDKGMFYLSSLTNNSTKPISEVKHCKIVSNLFDLFDNSELLKCH